MNLVRRVVTFLIALQVAVSLLGFEASICK